MRQIGVAIIEHRGQPREMKTELGEETGVTDRVSGGDKVMVGRVGGPPSAISQYAFPVTDAASP